MKTIISISIFAITICAVIFIMKKTGRDDPDKEIDKNYTKRMMSRYK